MFNPYSSGREHSFQKVNLDLYPKGNEQGLREIIVDTEAYTRHDGRYPEQLRDHTITPGPLSKSCGSAWVGVAGPNGSKHVELLISVCPPRPASRSKVLKPQGQIECRVRTVSGKEHEGKQELARSVETAMMCVARRESFPFCFVVLDILIVSGDISGDRESILACAINGAGVAMAHAGIELASVPVAIPFALHASSLLLLDHDSEERKLIGPSPKGVVVVGIRDGKANELLHVDIQGVFEEASLLADSLRQISEGSVAVFEACIRPAYLKILN